MCVIYTAVQTHRADYVADIATDHQRTLCERHVLSHKFFVSFHNQVFVTL